MKNTLKNELTLYEKIEIAAEKKRNWENFPKTFVSNFDEKFCKPTSLKIKEAMVVNWEITWWEIDF